MYMPAQDSFLAGEAGEDTFRDMTPCRARPAANLFLPQYPRYQDRQEFQAMTCSELEIPHLLRRLKNTIWLKSSSS